MIAANMAPIMFGGLVFFMVAGYPAAFSLAGLGLFFAAISIELGLFVPDFLQSLPLRVFAILSNDLLLAIPFFTFMGLFLEKSGLAEDLLEGIGQLCGAAPGGLAYAVILVGAVFGAITGTVAGSVIAMGLISLPVMMRYGYNMRLATGVIAASGTIAQVIPPSLVLIVLADQLGRSVGDMYAGAVGPSVAQILVFIAYIFVLSLLKPAWMPTLPASARTLKGLKLWRKVLMGMVPALALIFLVLGTIFMGLATPTEAGAMGAVGAILLTAVRRRLTWPLMQQAMDSTMRLTTMVIFILMGATVFSLVFQGVDGGKWVEHLLSDLPGGPTGFLVFVSLFVFFLAFFLDYFEIAFIIVPLLAPVALKLGIDLVWFGVLLCVTIQTSFMHPPFGFALFYLRGIAPPTVKTGDIYLGAIPWVLLQLLVVALVIFWPGLVTRAISNEATMDPSKVEIRLDPQLSGESSEEADIAKPFITDKLDVTPPDGR